MKIMRMFFRCRKGMVVASGIWMDDSGETRGNIYLCYKSNILHFLQLPKLPTTYICECPLETKELETKKAVSS